MHFLFEKRKPDKQLAVVEKVLSLLLFVEFEIIGSSAGWMRAENTLIQTAGYAFLNTISVYSVSKYFRTFIPLHAADKFKYSSETEIPSVVLLDQTEVFQYNISHLFIRHIKDFFFNQPVANGFCLR